MMDPKLSNPKAVAEQGESIYQEKYRKEFERLYPGKFVAIDTTNGQAYVSDTAEGAIKKGQERTPQGVFHLIRVGQAGAFRVSTFTYRGQPNWFPR